MTFILGPTRVAPIGRLTLLEFWSTLKLATLCSVTSCPIWEMMYSASLVARKDFPVPLGPERMIRRCSIRRLRYRWMIGLGIRVSNTRLSMLFSFTPRMEEGTVWVYPFFSFDSRRTSRFARRDTFEIDPDDVIIAHQVAAGQQLRHLRGVRADHLAHSVADDAVWAETQASVRIHPEHILLRGRSRAHADKYRRRPLFVATSWDILSDCIFFNIHLMYFLTKLFM